MTPTLNRDLRDQLVDAMLDLPDIEERSTRNTLLNGIRVSIRRTDNAHVDLTTIISQLDPLGRLDNGERPVVILAHNAARMALNTELGRRLATLEALIEEAYGSELDLAGLPAQPEALVFGGPGEWVTPAFIEQARIVGRSVARLLVPAFQNGLRQDHSVVGTGWLIGARLLLTNHHVIDARQAGQPNASLADFTAQARHTAAWFDYHVEGGARIAVEVDELVASSLRLDYAVLRLADVAELHDRPPLAIPQQSGELGRGTRLNIVQCPGGGPLRFAIRNNFYVGRGQHEFHIRYLTDTIGGSSGSPVLDDNWQAVALHHGATRVDKRSYGGEPGAEGIVKFHNQGIAIRNILGDLPVAVAAEVKQAQRWG